MASSVHLFSCSSLSAARPCKYHHRHCHRCRSHHHRCKHPSLDIFRQHPSSSRWNSGASCQRFLTKSRVYRSPIAGKMSSSQESLPLTALNVSQGKKTQNTEELQEDDLENGYYESQFRNIPRREISLMGVKLSPDLVAIVMVYFVQGVLGLSRLAVSFYLKDDLHLDPAESAIISGLSAAPWLIKPIYGFISDGLPLFGYRRRSYLVLCGLLGASAWAMMAMLVDNKYTAALAIITSSLSVAFSDVVVDSMAVERARGESQSTSGSIQSLCWGSSAFGGIVSAYFSGSLIETYGVRFVFSITALLPLITSAVAVFVTEEKVSKAKHDIRSPEIMSSSALERSRAQLIYLWKTMKEPSIFLPTLFIFLLQATPTSDTAMFFFTTNKLGFGPEFLGRVRLITSIASLAGVGIYNGLLKSVPLRKMFFWTTIVGCGLSLTQLVLVTGVNQEWGISNEWFAMGDTLILTVLGQVSFMPILVLAARICPPGIEATLFATLMSISNGGSVCGGLIGASLTQFLGITSQNFDNLALLIILCNASSLLPLPLLGLLPSENTKPSEYKSLDRLPDIGDEIKRK